MNTILMTEEYLANSRFSIARYYGGIKINGIDYIIVNKVDTLAYDKDDVEFVASMDEKRVC